MPYVDIKHLTELQNEISKVRNICILAHVDHGKTTLADSLVASNGIISQRMAGKLRYLDNRPDEQERGITMKSSSISLFYQNYAKDDEFLINLIDSPGHVDFSSEVSTAVRLCDGAIIVVDVVEGVGPQTRACLQQTYSEHLKPILLLNKIDRLILEKKMSPLDAYVHLTQILEQINAVIGNIFASDIYSKEDAKNSDNNYTSALDDCDDSSLYFAPELGNVIFCSAIDGWAFTISDFAEMYSERLEMKIEELEKVLWGDFYYNAKKKCCIPGAQERAKKPMFVQFVFENIWNLYDIIVVRKDKEKLPNVAEKLGIKLTARDLRLTEPKVQLKTLFDQWLPIDRAVLKNVVENIPPPNSISDERAERLLCPMNCDFNSYPHQTQNLKDDFKNCNRNSENIIAYVSKMIPIEKSRLPQNKPKPLTQEEIQNRRDIVKQKILERKKLADMQDNISQISEQMETLTTGPKDDIENKEIIEESIEDNQVFVAFARIFSGTLKKGMKLFVLAPKHDPRNNDSDLTASPYISEVIIGDLYLLMGGELESLDEVPAGNIVGIGGLENVVIKAATLSSTTYCPSFSEINLMATPILKVALEPVNPLEMPKLIKGLKLLNQADACVQVAIQETGEHVITTLGEVHVEKCVRDLEENYAKIKLNVSKPIVSFRETIVPEATIDMVNEAILNLDRDMSKKIVRIQTSNKAGTIKLLALPLPQSTIDILEKNTDLLKILSASTKSSVLSEKQISLLKQIKHGLSDSLKSFKMGNISSELNLIDKIWSIGPRKCGTNILLNLSDYVHSNFWNPENSINSDSVDDIRKDFNSSFVNGFQLASGAGPLCGEPMTGVCFVILAWKIENEIDLNSKVFGPFSGQVMSTIKEGCKRAFQNQPQRLVSPMYSCNIVVNAEVLGKMYAVIGRRNGKVISGDLTHGSGNFAVTAILPVIESFNLAQEIRKQTSGLACPQLVVSHWEIIDIDPFWVPSTEEEYTHFGEKADSANRAKVYMDSVRKRKGLYVEEKIVEHAEKQRTLSKNK